MPKVEQILETEEKITFSELLNDVFPETKKIFEDGKIKEEPKTEFPLPKFNETVEELSKGNIPSQLYFFVGGQNSELQNRIMQPGID